MPRYVVRMMAVMVLLALAALVQAGSWTTNNFFYKPAIGARGQEAVPIEARMELLPDGGVVLEEFQGSGDAQRLSELADEADAEGVNGSEERLVQGVEPDRVETRCLQERGACTLAHLLGKADDAGENVLKGRVSHERTAALLAVDEAVGNQTIEHLSNRGAAHTVRGNQIRLRGNYVAGFPFAVRDVVAENLVELMVQRQPVVPTNCSHLGAVLPWISQKGRACDLHRTGRSVKLAQPNNVTTL